jgi:hypothetical protein
LKRHSEILCNKISECLFNFYYFSLHNNNNKN